MSSVQGHVIFPVAVRAKQTKVQTPPVNGPLRKYRISRSGFWGVNGISCGKTNVGHRLRLHNVKVVKCSFSSSSDGNGSMAENSNENEAEYVNCSVTDAVEVESSSDGFIIKMRDGRHLRCARNNPEAGNLPDYAPHPAMVLKMEDGTGLLLPVIVLEMQSAMLTAALGNVQLSRPTIYDVMMEMIDKMGYAVKLVRITKRVHEAYFSQLYLTKLEDEAENVAFDLRPSDAINIAVRCKVPIQVNKSLAYSDGMRVIESAKLLYPDSSSDGLQSTELDRPSGQPCFETKEFDLLCKMWTAAIEERYKEAAQWRDKLIQFRSNMNWA
ncbi:Bifunctional nuclease 1 [Heracleum sosnowskyi]|uniref:Bifunctional nuclease 1 n=1 Tax=Heracleum sosnowskyi TaxID=360622 RepID=A0AAD8MMF1_9APIA|nr:Bifunctional nuclease 1 [Heracleum sosnowskyi]